MVQEGVIKFQLNFQSAPPLAAAALHGISGWRQVLFRLQLIGRDPARYGGFGYGNISCRLDDPAAEAGQHPFVISGTQTGGLPALQPCHFVTVQECDPVRNRVVAAGPIRPSSEALTHGTVYALDRRVRCVIHVHSPEIWQQTAALQLPCTDPQVAYGTPEMADEVRKLLNAPDMRAGRVFAMGGHEDGIVAFGADVDEAGAALTALLARALAAISA